MLLSLEVPCMVVMMGLNGKSSASQDLWKQRRTVMHTGAVVLVSYLSGSCAVVQLHSQHAVHAAPALQAISGADAQGRVDPVPVHLLHPMVGPLLV